MSDAALLDGVPYSLQHLRDKHERIDWSAFLQIMRNAGRIWSDAELVSMGGAFLRSPFMRPAALIARLLFSTKDFYSWVYGDARRGAGVQAFTCVEPSYRDLGGDRIAITVRVRDGYEAACKEFFLVSQGLEFSTPPAFGAIEGWVVQDLNANDIDAACRMIAGSARSMGLEVVE